MRIVYAWNVLMFLICCTVGCGGSDKPLVLVSGQVTYAGGEWPIPGRISFSPISTGKELPSRPGSAAFKTDGKFAAGSYKPGDGLLPGTYAVNISVFDPSKVQGRPLAEVDLVPSDFKPEPIVVEPGQDAITLNFDVPKKK